MTPVMPGVALPGALRCRQSPVRLRVLLVAALAGSAAVSPALGWPAPEDPEKDEAARRRDVLHLMALTDALAAGTPAGSGLALAWEPHYLKGEAGQTYVPFSLTISEHSRQPAAFVVYLRVVPTGVTPPAGEGGPAGMELATLGLPPGELPVGGAASQHRRSSRYGEASARLGLVDREREGARGPYIFEDSHVVEVMPGDDIHPFRLRRALAVPPGEHVLYVAVSEVGDTPATARSAVMRQALAARDFSEDALSLSSLIVAERVEPLPAPLEAKLQARRPYAVGSLEIVPVAGRELAQDAEPAVVFQIYNAGLGAGRKPNVGIEYLLLRLAAELYVPHARLPSQQLDARTLPAGFDPEAGHQLGAVQDLPLSLLPPGEYLLEVTVTDNVQTRSARAAVDFAVRER